MINTRGYYTFYASDKGLKLDTKFYLFLCAHNVYNICKLNILRRIAMPHYQIGNLILSKLS